MTRHLKWIASYPKSGNTWLRFIAFILVNGKLPKNSIVVDKFASTNFTYIDRTTTTYRKTHMSAEALKPWWDATVFGAYICRHPLDTMCSALNYHALIGGVDFGDGVTPHDEGWRREYVDRYIEHEGVPEYVAGDRNYGTWNANVSGWMFADLPFPVLRLRYEDLLASPREEIRKIADFLGVEAPEELIDLALSGTQFGAMRRMEETEIAAANAEGRQMGRFSGDARRKAAAQGFRFFSKGKARNYASVLTAEQIDRAWSVFGAVGARLGYDV